MENKRIVMDLDGCLRNKDMIPNKEVIKKLKEYMLDGFYIIIHSSKNMRTFKGNIGKINAITLPQIIEWLKNNDVPYDEIYVGKPWCGFEGFYVDDKTIRPDEFVNKSKEEINDIIL